VARNAGSGTVTFDGTEMKVIVVGRTAYVQVGDAFWRQHSKAKDAELLIQRLRGKWLKVPCTARASAFCPALPARPTSSTPSAATPAASRNRRGDH
jgi:hypothetical protein